MKRAAAVGLTALTALAVTAPAAGAEEGLPEVSATCEALAAAVEQGAEACVIVVTDNVGASNGDQTLSVPESQTPMSSQKLSSGFRINSAPDVAAGLVISENLRSQVGGLKVASRNAQDGISVVQTADGALTEVHSMLQRMRDLAVQAGNGTNTADSIAAGATQNRLEQTISTPPVGQDDLTASESRIRDTDMALEMSRFTRNQILTQAGTAMLAQAYSAPQNVLQLLRG